MIPAFIDRILSNTPGAIGSSYLGYKSYRWGDPHVRLISRLADRDRVSIDVGAHVGEYTYFLQRYSAGCVAFECIPDLVETLRRRFGKSVDIRPEAVSNVNGTAVLRIPKSRTATDLVRATIEDTNELRGNFTEMLSLEVKTVRLDDAVKKRVGLLKVDVEGHEMAVLEGASRILDEDRPNLILELEERHSPGILQKAFGLLEGMGYQASYYLDGRLVPFVFGENLPPGLWNFVFNHSQRL